MRKLKPEQKRSEWAVREGRQAAALSKGTAAVATLHLIS